MSLNGALINLEAGDYHAVIAAVGATLASLRHRDRDLVVPFDAQQQIGKAAQGRVLVPWPNRIADGGYSWEGERFDLPVNEPNTGAALHGHGSWYEFATEQRFSAGAKLTLDLPGTPGYPFDLFIEVTYALDAKTGLHIEISGTNRGVHAAPYAASIHPYLTAGGAGVDVCDVRLPAARVLTTNDKSIPTGEQDVSGTELDLNQATSCAGKSIDHTYVGLPAGNWSLRLTYGDEGVQLSSDTRWAQLYTGEKLDRRGLAVEPMTCAPDAFNQDPDGVRLAPGERRTLSLSLRAVTA